MKIAILGGSFNPPHKGHVYIAREARQRFSLDKVLFMVAAEPPHKSIAFGVDADMRLGLTKAALMGEDGLFACDYELKRQGKSYTADTLKQVRSIYPDAELYLIVGADMLENLPHWKEPETIFSIADIIAVSRPNCGDDNAAAQLIRQRYGVTVLMAGFSGPDISSTAIRDMVTNAVGIAKLVPRATMELIYQKLLYQPEYILSYAQKLSMMIKPKRFCHSKGTMGYAVELASVWGEDGEKGRIAGLLHDCAKLGDGDAVALAEKYGYEPSEEERRAPGLLHGPLGAIRVQREFGVDDKDVIEAIACHVYGRMGMSKLDKILFVSDKAEFTRDYDGVEALREASQKSLDEAVLMTMDRSMNYLMSKGAEPAESSIRIRNSIKNGIQDNSKTTFSKERQK